MDKNHKKEVVKNLTEKFKNSSALYFTKYTGMSVEQATMLRQKFSDNSVEFLVSKNTLTKIASEKAGFGKDLFDDFLLGQIAIAYAMDDPTAPAKVIKDFHKDNECLEVVGLYFDGELYSPEKYKEIADLPSKDILLTKFIIGINYPMTSVVVCLQSTMLKVINVLQAIKKQKD